MCRAQRLVCALGRQHEQLGIRVFEKEDEFVVAICRIQRGRSSRD